MGCLGRALRSLLMLWLIFFFIPASICLLTAFQSLSKPESLKEVFNASNSYTSLWPSIMDAALLRDFSNFRTVELPSIASNGEVNVAQRPFARALTAERLSTISPDLLPAAWMRETVDGVIGAIATGLQSQSSTYEINLTGLKQFLSDETKVDNAVRATLATLPQCSTRQDTLLQTSLNNPTPAKFNSINVCRPRNPDLLGTFTAYLTNNLVLGSNILPDKTTPLGNILAPDEVRAMFQVFNQLPILIISFLVILLLIVGLLSGRGLRRLFDGPAITLLTSAILSAITLVGFRALIMSDTSSTTDFSVAEKALFDNLFFQPSLMLAVLLGVIGFVLLILSRAMPKPQSAITGMATYTPYSTGAGSAMRYDKPKNKPKNDDPTGNNVIERIQ